MFRPPPFLRNFGAEALACFATLDLNGLPSRSLRSKRRLVGGDGLEPPTLSV